MLRYPSRTRDGRAGLRPDPAVCDSVWPGAESDPGTGGPEPSADRLVRMCGMDRGMDRGGRRSAMGVSMR